MNDNPLAQKVKALRKSKGLSQEALAGLAGLSLRTVQRIENENKNPSGDTLKRLSTALGVSPDYLIEWEPNENSNFLLFLAISPILFVIHPFLAILVPLILWASKKHIIKGVKNLGIKVLSIQTIWLVTYYTFRTLNFFRLQYKVTNTPVVNETEYDSFFSDFKTQFYLKTFFIIANIFIILFVSYKTYRRNKINYSTIAS